MPNKYKCMRKSIAQIILLPLLFAILGTCLTANVSLRKDNKLQGFYYDGIYGKSQLTLRMGLIGKNWIIS